MFPELYRRGDPHGNDFVLQGTVVVAKIVPWLLGFLAGDGKMT